MTDPDPRSNVERIFRSALASVDASSAVSKSIERRQGGFSVCDWDFESTARVAVIAIGKAATPMAAAAASALPPKAIAVGLVVTKDGHAEGHDLSGYEVLETSHPVPDSRCADAGRRVLEIAAQSSGPDLLLVLLSGGASSLVSLPPEGVRQEDLSTMNELLLASGADIRELNTVRKHVSQISGGRLAAHAHAKRIAVLAISDVPGDSLDVIGSGPCAADPTRYEDETIRGHLLRGRDGKEPESPKPADEVFERVRHRIVASNEVARSAAIEEAGRLGARTVSLGECIAGEARLVAKQIVACAIDESGDVPTCLVAGGESVVKIEGAGIGGRNQELALAAAIAMEGSELAGAVVLAAGTDGTDGPTEAAGAWADAGTAGRGRSRGLDIAAFLADNDSNSFFREEGGLFATGPTGTNVMDLVIVWIPPNSG